MSVVVEFLVQDAYDSSCYFLTGYGCFLVHAFQNCLHYYRLSRDLSQDSPCTPKSHSCISPFVGLVLPTLAPTQVSEIEPAIGQPIPVSKSCMRLSDVKIRIRRNQPATDDCSISFFYGWVSLFNKTTQNIHMPTKHQVPYSTWFMCWRIVCRIGLASDRLLCKFGSYNPQQWKALVEVTS